MSIKLPKLLLNPIARHVILLLIPVLYFLWRNYSVVTFSHQLLILDNILLLVVLLTPSLLILNGFSLLLQKYSPQRLIIAIVNACIFAFPAMMGSIMFLWGAVDLFIPASMIMVNEIKLPHSIVRLYKYDGGATTDTSYNIRQELDFFPGLILFKKIYSGEYQDRPTLQSGTDDTITVEIQKLKDVERQEIKLLPYVYW